MSKEIYSNLKKEFGLSLENLQERAILIIDGQKYEFTIRLINMNRSKVAELLLC